VIDFSVALGRVICVADPEQAAERDARMIPEARASGLRSPVPGPRLGPGCWLPESPQGGAPFVQGRVERGGELGRFDDVVGRGFALVSTQRDPARGLSDAQRAYFASLGGISAHVAPEGALRDVDCSYARWFETEGVAVALQRPDFVVFATAKDAGEAGRLVDALRARLSGC
jgi:hypothetical protein